MISPSIQELSESLQQLTTQRPKPTDEGSSDVDMPYTDLAIGNVLAYETAGPVNISELSIYATILQAACADLFHVLHPTVRMEFTNGLKERLQIVAQEEHDRSVKVPHGDRVDIRAVYLKRGLDGLIGLIGAADPASVGDL